MLDARARATGTTPSLLVRGAIDAFLADEATSSAAGLARMRTALERAKGVAAHLPSGARYVEELRSKDNQRANRLDERRWA